MSRTRHGSEASRPARRACLALAIALGSSGLFLPGARAAFPPAGTDNFVSTASVLLDFNATATCPAGQYPVTLAGPISISHANAVGDTVNLTFNSLSLSGFAGGAVGNVTFTLAGPSSGTAIATVGGSGDFPANSTLNVNYSLATACGTYTGTHVLTAVIQDFPPLASDIYGGAPSSYAEGATPNVGMLTTSSHSRSFHNAIVSQVPAMNRWTLVLLSTGIIALGGWLIWSRSVNR